MKGCWELSCDSILFFLFAWCFSDTVNSAPDELLGENAALMGATGPRKSGKRGVGTFVFHTLFNMENIKSVLV